MPEACDRSSALHRLCKGPWEITSDNHKERRGELQTPRNESIGGQTAALRLVKYKTSQSSKKVGGKIRRGKWAGSRWEKIPHCPVRWSTKTQPLGYSSVTAEQLRKRSGRNRMTRTPAKTNRRKALTSCLCGRRQTRKKTTSGMLLGLIKGAVLQEADVNLLDWQPGGEDHITRNQAEQVKRGSEMDRGKNEAPQQTGSKRLLFLPEGAGCASTGGRAGLPLDGPQGTDCWGHPRCHLIPDSLVIHHWWRGKNRPPIWPTCTNSKAH